ncbi:MAG: XRE family transcriptional regulator, partial [Chloroflexi bacterium]|nr:XRE family transcriptional regulator [Chloroflexota bacterium]
MPAVELEQSAAFGDLLRGHRLAAGLSQDELAERAGLSRRGVSDLERGARHPHPGTVRRLAVALDLGDRARADLTSAAHSRLAGPHGRERARSNLSNALSSFVGRERELAQIRTLLATAPLLTLTGPGGVGKTRLGLEVAGQLASTSQPYVDGVYLLELAPLSEGALVPRAVAAGLGVRDVPGQPLLATMMDWLQSRQLLLILDNCEHLIAACAAVAESLLHASPRLTILATSREPLNIEGEIVLPIAPLAADSDGLQLFVDRARQASPGFEITSQNRAAAVHLCQQLDGLPLAIELAAARVNTMTVEEIEQRLDRRFTWLTTSRRSAAPRHQTLRALVDWSYELLTGEERRLLEQLSVFAGGWTLESAEAVCGPTLDVLRLMSSLVDKSLVQVEQQAGQSRYRLLETLRQYAIEKLREAHAEPAARNRHLDWYERFSKGLEQQVHSP